MSLPAPPRIAARWPCCRDGKSFSGGKNVGRIVTSFVYISPSHVNFHIKLLWWILVRRDMNKSIEIAITCDLSGALFTCCVWDAKTGNHLMVYRGGGAVNPRCVSLVDNKFLLTSDAHKPLLHIWPINSQEQVRNKRFVMPGCVSALATSPDGTFIVAGVAEVVYVWHFHSGKMVASLGRHFQTITVIRFHQSGSHFVTAGQDGMILVWQLARCVDLDRSATIEPLYKFTHHSLPVQDVHVGCGAAGALIYSVSADRTCKVFDFASGALVMNLVFQEALTAITVDKAESRAVVGTADGPIYEVRLQAPPRSREIHMDSNDVRSVFMGHTGSVMCLSISLDGVTLLSGGEDANVCVWHIPTKQLIRVISHKAAVTNAFFTLTPSTMFDEEVEHQLGANTFQRMMETVDKFEELTIDVEAPADGALVPQSTASASQHAFSNANSTADAQKHEYYIRQLRKINTDLYKYIVDNQLGK
ncbi:WD repeat-containing protein 18 [Phlebotomus argentipes]|uniref:WD repeat-containing protein 18 n=1 Tax=Phlebotomus argentipes TaxID=94469 RepID=UPI0028933E2A|nr:WD repeat-containing protein 18 [Phlebotomus argentipes]